MSDEFVNAMHNGNNLEAETAFKNAIQQKVGDALETRRKEVANTFVKTATKEKENDEGV